MEDIIYKGSDILGSIKLVENNLAIHLVDDIVDLKVVLEDSAGNEREKYSRDAIDGYIPLTVLDQTTNKGEFTFPINRELTAKLPEGNLTAKIFYSYEDDVFKDGEQVARQNVLIGVIIS